MAQWVNHLWNNIIVNLPSLLSLCGISGALYPVQLGLMAGRQTKFSRILKILEFATDRDIWLV